MFDYPGDKIPEIRLVWTTGVNGLKVEYGLFSVLILMECLSLQDLLLAFDRSIDYKNYFGTEDDLSLFTQFIKEHGGLLDHRVNVDFRGKKTHYASAIPVMYFGLEIRKRLIKLVSNSLYPSLFTIIFQLYFK